MNFREYITEAVKYDKNDMKTVIKELQRLKDTVTDDKGYENLMDKLSNSDIDEIMVDTIDNIFGSANREIERKITIALQKNYEKNGTEQTLALELIAYTLKKIK